MKKRNLFILLAVLVMVLATLACASGNPYSSSTAPAGFFKGAWDGGTAGISFFISLINPSYGIYEVNNTGWLYDLGYLMVISGAGYGAGAASKRRSR